MADDNKPPEGGTGAAEAELAKLKSELEAARAEAQREKSEREKLESIRAELEETRQAAKERERKALEEQGQYKTIAEQQKAELDRLTAEAAASKATLEAAQAQLDEIVKAQREELLVQIPEGEERDKWKDASIDILRNAVPLYAKANGSPAPPKGAPAGGYKGAPPDFASMTLAEQALYAKENKMTPQEIIRARQNAKNKR